MFFRKILVIVLALPLMITFGDAEDVFAAKISNCSNCSETEQEFIKLFN